MHEELLDSEDLLDSGAIRCQSNCDCTSVLVGVHNCAG